MEAFLGLGIVGMLAIFFIWYVLLVIGYWKLFEKAGKPGWHSIIPILNTYDQYDMCWSGIFGIIYAIGIRKSLRFRAQGKEYVLHKGSMWWAITPALATLALQYWDENTDYVRYFHDGFAPDETFIHTITAHSAFAPQAIRLEGKFKNLEGITPLTFIDYTHGIKVFTEEDFEELIQSDKMFCRKTVTGTSDRLMDMIDAHRNTH